MKKKQYINKLIQIDCGELNNEYGFSNGYLLDFSPNWTLIQFVDGEIYFDGYKIFSGSIINKLWELDEYNHMIHRAFLKLGYKPVKPKVNLIDVNAIVTSAYKLFPLIVIHRDILNKDECDIGGISNVTKDTITLATIEPNAEYGEECLIESKDITKIAFGGHYETALWAVVSKRTKDKLIKVCKRYAADSYQLYNQNNFPQKNYK